ncbi:MAG: hypothetical protein ACW964_13805 [Candidatus Hodarchaeales archaeon]|jgi:DNA-directed RNA polymerase subunit M/transcription elongation factor TFIIS
MADSPFCQKCGSLVTPKRKGASRKIILWCTTCKMEVGSKYGTRIFQERISIDHTPQEFTRILENNEPPPVPKIFTQSYKDRRKKRCRHPNAIFKGFYQFSRGDEASRKYWYCSDCGQVFRFSGKMNVKSKKRVIYENEEE